MRSTTKRLCGALLGLLCAGQLFAAGTQINFISGFDDARSRAPVGGNTGTTIGEQRRIAIQFAADFIASQLVSTQTIVIDVSFQALTCTPTSATLGSASAYYLSGSGTPRADTWYPAALLDAELGFNVHTGADLFADFNSLLDNGSCLGGDTWYYGLNNATPAGQENFLDTAVHELLHGLGFATLTDSGTGAYSSDLPTIYDYQLYDLDANDHWTNLNQNARRNSAVNNGRLVWNGSAVNNAGPRILNTGLSGNASQSNRVRMYAPSVNEDGSSVSHWDVTLSPDQLMEPFSTDSASYNASIELSLCLLRDIGWELTDSSLCPLEGTPPPTNNAPVALNDSFTVNEDSGTQNLAVLSNDSDADNDSITLVAVSGIPSQAGSLAINNNQARYQPANNYCGNFNFNYRISDGSDSDDANVAVTVNCVNDAPIALNDSYQTNQNNTLTVASTGVLANDSDVDDSTLNAILVSNVSNGSLSLNSNGSFSYSPNSNFTGTDQFSYRASDGDDNSDPATVAIQVIAVNNQAPSAVNDSYTVNEDSGNHDLAVLINDNDADGDAIALSSLSNIPSQVGSLSINGNQVRYQTANNYCGNFNFTYRISDGTDSDDADVTVTVNCVNDTPVARNDSYQTNQNSALAVAGRGVLANDSDVDDSTLSAILVSNVSNGSLSLNNNGSFSYSPNSNFTGTDQFRYRANDGDSNSAIATATINVIAVNPPPQTTGIPPQSAIEGQSFAVNLRPFFSDDGDTISFSSNNVPSGFSLASNGLFSGTASDTVAANAPYEINVTATDNDGASTETRFTLAIETIERDLAITLDASPQYPTVGNTVNYRITVSNFGAASASGVVVQSNLYGSLQLSTADNRCNISGINPRRLECQLPSALASSNSTNFSFSFSSNQQTDVFATAEVSHSTTDSNPANNRAKLQLSISQSTQEEALQQLASGQSILDIASADFNNDGRTDLVTAGPSGSYFFTNQGGSFNQGTRIDSTPSRAVATGDIDGNGLSDVIAVSLAPVSSGTNPPSYRYQSYLNTRTNNNVGFSRHLAGVIENSSAITLKDVNGDNVADLISANRSPNLLLLNNGNGGFNAGFSLGNAESNDVIATDLDNDGDNDLVFANDNGGSYWINTGNNFVGPNLLAADKALAVVAADFNNDGFIDLAFASASDDSNTPNNSPVGNPVYISNGQVNGLDFSLRTRLGALDSIDITAGDYDADGDIDISVLNQNGSQQLYRNNGNASFTRTGQQLIVEDASAILSANINNDNRPDLAIGAINGGGVRHYGSAADGQPGSENTNNNDGGSGGGGHLSPFILLLLLLTLSRANDRRSRLN